ncbi:MAG: DUF2974 domain-containing protein [Treponema sp.]|nr:DUF2974 domain-containing protein [Treponema sp.]MCI7566481.1 DUF2974 domain-containing protein [Treponema sp.]
MANLFDYVAWRGDISFDTIPFNKIDALLLSHLSYSLLNGLVPSSFEESKTLSQLSKDFKAASDYEDRLKIGFVINKNTPELLAKTAKSLRFKNVRICGYREIFSEENVEQFAAMTYIIKNGKNEEVIISYRGTDDTLVGWKEDFNIVWQDQIPAQKDALVYIEDAAKFFKNGFVIVGHSKGGNLAINTAVKCGEKIQKRIKQIYNFDGPGFAEDFFNQPEYLAIESKLVNIYPEMSLVGMIFHHPKKYEIVKSDGFAVMQHDPLTWQIMGNSFENKRDFTKESKRFYSVLNEWVERLEPEQTKKFVTALWDIIMASDVKTLAELSKSGFISGAKMFGKMATMDRESKEEVRVVLDLLRDIVFKDTQLGKVLRFKKEL